MHITENFTSEKSVFVVMLFEKIEMEEFPNFKTLTIGQEHNIFEILSKF
jgi:hypothetical protein